MSQRWQKRTVYAILTVSTVFNIAYFFFAVFQCGVPDPYWSKKLYGECVSMESVLGMGYAHATITALTDLILALLPIPVIHQARIKPQEKTIIYGILVLATV
jgi:hypothetical protein